MQAERTSSKGLFSTKSNTKLSVSSEVRDMHSEAEDVKTSKASFDGRVSGSRLTKEGGASRQIRLPLAGCVQEEFPPQKTQLRIGFSMLVAETRAKTAVEQLFSSTPTDRINSVNREIGMLTVDDMEPSMERLKNVEDRLGKIEERHQAFLAGLNHTHSLTATCTYFDKRTSEIDWVWDEDDIRRVCRNLALISKVLDEAILSPMFRQSMQIIVDRLVLVAKSRQPNMKNPVLRWHK